MHHRMFIRSLIRKETQKAKRKVLKKHEGNPILEPNGDNWWEAYLTFNPGAVLIGNKIHILYRAIGTDWISRLGYAMSKDGFNIHERHPEPAYERRSTNHTLWFSPSGGGFGGCEDPRVVFLPEDKRIYMTYTAHSEMRVGFTSIRVKDFVRKRWRWSQEKLISPPGEVHKNFALFPEKIDGMYAIIHSISPKVSIEYRESLTFEHGDYIRSTYAPMSYPGGWEWIVKGIGPPPMKTPEGWLVFYHGVDKKEPDKYKVGAMILDPENPEEILYRAKWPVIEPDTECEQSGSKPGIVYANGAVIKDNTVFVYYGGADNFTCVAHGDLKELIDAIKDRERFVFRKGRIVWKRRRSPMRWTRSRPFILNTYGRFAYRRG